MADNNQGWESWSNHVLLTLEKLEKKVDTVENRINENNLDTQVEIVSIKAKAAVWGVIAGFVVSAIVSIVVGVLVYQLTVGLHSNPETQKNLQPKPTINGTMMMPNKTRLEGFVISEGEYKA